VYNLLSSERKKIHEVFQKRSLTRTRRSKRQKGTKYLGKLHIKYLHSLYYSTCITGNIRLGEDELGEAYSKHGDSSGRLL
jgi:hypothetical protein